MKSHDIKELILCTDTDIVTYTNTDIVTYTDTDIDTYNQLSTINDNFSSYNFGSWPLRR